MLAEKTGYPKDMLELDLDMEADLGIDTVKQAELFASMREHFSLPKNDNLSLKDYPTIRHCIKFVMDGKGIGAPSTEVASGKSQVTSQTITTVLTKLEPEAEQANRHIRYVPKVVLSKADKGNIRKLSSKKPVIIFSDNAELTRLFKNELSKMKVVSHVFTSVKTKASNTIVNDWNDTEAVEKNLQDFAAKHNNVQGIVYLLGTVDKKLGKKTVAFEDLKHYAMPLFLAIKYFNKTLNTPEDGNSTFMAIITTIDGHMGYKTKKTYDPIYGAINGIALCARKELENCTVKLIDFAPSSSPELIEQKTFFEIIYSDSRLALSYDNNKRYTLMMTPESIETENEKLDLRGKKVLITGGGRGLGALFGKIMAEKYQPHIIIFDIINLAEESAAWAKMDENQLKELKAKLWEDLKASGEKATPVILERAFTKIKDSALLYKTIEELKATGSKVTYYCCDLNNPTIFNSTIESIRKEFGKLDGVVHFAGLERSKLIADKTIDEFYAVFNTKANSAMNLLHSEIVKERGFWVMISSIAGKFGNLGQSDYAAASDYISKLAISLQNKGARAFAVDMTAYANIGMAIRPGVEAFLKSQKVDFIYPNEGMLTIADELVYGAEPEIVLSASLGKMDWDTQLELADGMEFSEGSKNESHFHFIKDAKKNGDKAQGAKEFNIADDPYLLDHAINGTPLVPGVMGIETFAQTAAFTLGKNPKSLKNIRFQLPIKLLKNKPIRIKITAEKEDEDLISMKMESDFINSKGAKLGKTRTHFMGKASENFKSKWVSVDKTSIPTKKKYQISKEDIYKIYFHGPSFQVLDGIISLEKDKVLGVFKTPKMPLWQNKNENLIAHPMAIEAAFQTCGFRDIHFDSKMALPDSVDEIIIHDNDRTTDMLYIHAIHKGISTDGKSSYDAFVFDEKGKIRIEIKNYVGIPTQI
jgi:NAD(P)-dependent dehydrogenase (short-subunit alcohol dehydrogenase family)/3-hydroxymyristoyl/3-hydroxydecanoyl-(acyl carrier protein) dehydratase